jgi:hypothetical protein
MRARTQRRIASREAQKQSIRRSSPEISHRPVPARTYIWCIVLAAGTVAIYSRAMSHPFINFDDYDYVTQNPHVQARYPDRIISASLALSVNCACDDRAYQSLYFVPSSAVPCDLV